MVVNADRSGSVMCVLPRKNSTSHVLVVRGDSPVSGQCDLTGGIGL